MNTNFNIDKNYEILVSNQPTEEFYLIQKIFSRDSTNHLYDNYKNLNYDDFLHYLILKQHNKIIGIHGTWSRDVYKNNVRIFSRYYIDPCYRSFKVNLLFLIESIKIYYDVLRPSYSAGMFASRNVLRACSNNEKQVLAIVKLCNKNLPQRYHIDTNTNLYQVSKPARNKNSYQHIIFWKNRIPNLNYITSNQYTNLFE